MSTTRTFTPRQAEILMALLEMTPERWRSAVNKQLKGHPTHEQVQMVIADLNKGIEFIHSMRAELPPVHLLPAYFSHTRWPQDGVDNTMAWVHDPVSGSLQGLQLPGSDVEEMVRGLYTNLDDLIALGPELLKLASAQLDRAVLFPGRENQTPFQEISALPSMVTREQKLQLAIVLTEKKGDIDLSGLPKKDAAFVLDTLQRRLRKITSDLTSKERRTVNIRYNSGIFVWFGEGPKGGEAQDQVTHLVNSGTTKPSPAIEAWITSLLKSS